MDLGLNDKVAVITGSSVGIGLAIAESLASEGAKIVLCARGKERVEAEAVRVSDKYDVDVLAVACDVSTSAGVEELVKATNDRFGGIDILINNAGSGSNETVLNSSDEQWQKYWDLHVMAAVRLARAIAPSMIKRGGGVILHNASICAVQPLWYEPIYNVSKAALQMMSKSLSTELIPHNIRVNTVNPGLVLTPDWINTAKELTKDSGGDWQAYLDNIAQESADIKRFARPEEIADFFTFLASARASYSVGSTYFVDGGWLKTV